MVLNFIIHIGLFLNGGEYMSWSMGSSKKTVCRSGSLPSRELRDWTLIVRIDWHLCLLRYLSRPSNSLFFLELWNACPTDKLQLLSETFISPAITGCRKECGNIDKSKHLHCPPLFSPLSLLSWPVESGQYLIPFEIQTWQFPVLNLTTSKKREFNLDSGLSKAVFAVLWPSCLWWKC